MFRCKSQIRKSPSKSRLHTAFGTVYLFRVYLEWLLALEGMSGYISMRNRHLLRNLDAKSIQPRYPPGMICEQPNAPQI